MNEQYPEWMKSHMDEIYAVAGLNLITYLFKEVSFLPLQIKRTNIMEKHYPKWFEDQMQKSQIDEHLSVKQWLELIACSYSEEFPINHENQPGRPSKLTQQMALDLYGAFTNYGFMEPAADSLHINRSTVWRWKKKNPAIRDMHILVKAFLSQAKTQKPAYWAFRHRGQIRVMQRKKGIFSSPTRNAWGRPSLYKSEYCQSVATTIESTAKTCKVSKRTVITWSKEYPEFRSSLLLKRLERFAPLYEKQADKLEKQIHKALDIHEEAL
jgi:transposase-like protein